MSEAAMADFSSDFSGDFSTQEDVKIWLDRIEPAQRRREMAIIFAARTALRVAPLAFTEVSSDRRSINERLATMLLPIFRAAALPWVAGKYPTHDGELSSAARAAANAAFTAAEIAVDIGSTGVTRVEFGAASAAARAAACVAFATADEAARTAAAAADAAAFASDATFAAAAAFSTDTTFVDGRHTAAELASAPLWLRGAPESADQTWQALRSAMLRDNEDWRVWTDWYDARLLGDLNWPANEALEVARSLIDDAIWKQGPRAVNAEIARLVDLHSPKPPPPSATKPDFDAFISYATQDETKAREVGEVLEGAGYSTFAQFKDFNVGGNFVDLMNSGLGRSLRMVALYSPHYKASKHCQAEWATFYNLDPNGKQRRLIPLLISPTELDPLAQQVIYKSLVGLDRVERRRAILEAFDGGPPIAAPGAIKKALAEVASPEARINEHQQIDAGPNAIFDRPFLDQDLPELPSRQRGLADTIRKSLPRNAPVVLSHCLQSYSDHLLAMGTQPIMGYLGDLAAALYTECQSSDATDWKYHGVAKLFERFFANHEMLRTHFPLKHEEVIAQFPIDEDKASGAALRDPFKLVESAIKDLHNVEKATPEIVRAVTDNAAFANDLASLPRPKKGEVRPLITVKQRYVLGTIGFLVTIYNLVGTTASIYSIPEGAALMRVVAEAIERFMAFLL